MGATRLPTTSDAVYAKRRARYLATRTETLARYAKRYQEEKPARLAMAKACRDAARDARLLAKRRLQYGEDIAKLAMGYQAKLSVVIRAAKEGQPCMDCHTLYPFFVMDFDHVRGEKKCAVSVCKTVTAALAEIAKCDIVCANCHRKRTFQRRTDLHP